MRRECIKSKSEALPHLTFYLKANALMGAVFFRGGCFPVVVCLRNVFEGAGEVLKSPPTAVRAKLRSLVAIFSYGH